MKGRGRPVAVRLKKSCSSWTWMWICGPVEFPGVAGEAEDRSCCHPVAFLDPDAALLEVADVHELSGAGLEDDVVAGGMRLGLEHTGRVVLEAVENGNDRAVGGCEDRLLPGPVVLVPRAIAAVGSIVLPDDEVVAVALAGCDHVVVLELRRTAPGKPTRCHRRGVETRSHS